MTLALAGQGCLGKAADDEPVFILRGQDDIADRVVDNWAHIAAIRLGEGHPKVKEARALAEKMRAWPKKKQPD